MKKKWIFLSFLIIQIPLFAQNDMTIRYYNDTVFQSVTDTIETVNAIPDSVAKQREVIIPADSSDLRGHYIQVYAGLGYGSLGYNLPATNGAVQGSFSALLQLQYAYFFHPNWGVGAGLWFTNYTSTAQLQGDYVWTADKAGNPLYDTDLELQYQHHSSIHRWSEREIIHNIGIPISLQFQTPADHDKTRFFAALGVAPAFSVMKSYQVLEGKVEHAGFYPAWNLWLDNMHEFQTIDYRNAPEAKGELSVRPQVAVFVDLGAAIPISKQIDLFVGGYFNISANDANSSDKHDLGWKDKTFYFMDAYNGVYATNFASASHPWEAGIKVGIHWHYIAPDKHETEDYFEYFTREERDTNYVQRIDTIVIARADTVIPDHIIEVAKEVEKFNKIYFAFDSYQLTNKAKFYLNSIIGALNRVPDAKIMLDGHASTEGQDAYNDILSENRARTVRNYLSAHGVDKDRIVTAGHGSRIPNEDHEREEMRRDRRVEIKVVYNENVVNEQ